MNPGAGPGPVAPGVADTTARWTGAPGVAAPVVENLNTAEQQGLCTDYFVHLADAAALLQSLGFIGGTGTSVAFPGTSTALANAGTMSAAVEQQVPNHATTSATVPNVTGALDSIGATTGVAARGSGTSGTT